VTEPRILVIGPSLVAAVMNLLASRPQLANAKFDIFGIHGPAFTTPNLIEASGATLYLKDVDAEGARQSWFSSIPNSREIVISNYDGVLFLDPLFMLGGFMRWRLWQRGEGICLEFLNPEVVEGRGQFLKVFRPISSAEWLAIYTDWRQGTMKILQSLRAVAPAIPILLLPPANPPLRLNPGIYPQYNMAEQAFLGAHLEKLFRTRHMLQPKSTLDENFCTLDRFHEPAPDPHHPNVEYYKVLFDEIDFESMSFKEGFLFRKNLE